MFQLLHHGKVQEAGGGGEGDGCGGGESLGKSSYLSTATGISLFNNQYGCTDVYQWNSHPE